MKKVFPWLFFVTSACFLSTISCTTELDLYAPEEDIWVVYGILNQEDSVQYIRVSKAFQVEGDALEYSSSNSPAVAGLNLVLDGPDGSLVAQEVDTVLRDSGLFPGNQTIYRFETGSAFRLKPRARYYLRITADSLPGFFLEAHTRIPAAPAIMRPSAGVLTDSIACLTRWTIEDSLRIVFSKRSQGMPPPGAYAYQYSAELYYRENGTAQTVRFGPGKPFLASRGCGTGSGNIVCIDIPEGQILDVFSRVFSASGNQFGYDGLEACALAPELLPAPVQVTITAIDSMLGRYLVANDPRYTNFNTVRREFSNLSGSDRVVGIFGSIANGRRIVTLSNCAERRLGLDGQSPDPNGC